MRTCTDCAGATSPQVGLHFCPAYAPCFRYLPPSFLYFTANRM